MKRIFLISKYLSLILIALMLWHYEGIWLYARAQAQAARVVTLPKEIQGNRFDSLLQQLRELVKQGAMKTKAAPEKGFADFNELLKLKESLVAENDKIQEHFDQLEKFLKQKELSDEILNRHQQFVREYDAKYETLMARLEGIESAHSQTTGLLSRLTGNNKNVNWDGVIGQTLNFLDANTSHAAERHFDPNNLPHRSLKADRPVQPKLTREEWLKAFPADSAAKVDAPSSTKSKNPIAPSATAPPTPADLAETIEVKFTPEIRQLADSLQKNPVKIFNWVRNNIEFVPTWGSIQGAQLCLETRSCNAFDTSSLLISLLRYSGIPARYQMGTIEVPVEKFKNWAGGFTNAEAAASLFASSGVPSVVRRVNQGGQVVTVKLEHVWVKAFVDYAPSGGAVQHQGDTWVEMDGGYKQYSFINGLDLDTEVPSNFQSFAIQLARAATIDNSTGSVTGLSSAAMTSFVQENADQRINHLRTNFTNARVRDVFGGKAIVSSSLALLPATVPYRVLGRADERAQIPAGLRHQVTLGLGSNPQAPDDTDLLSYTASLPELAGKNTLLLYGPASPADEQILLQLQSQHSIPAFVSFVPQLYVGSQLIATGSPVRAGRTLTSQITFSAPTITTPTIFNTAVAGEVSAIGLDLQGVSQSQVEALRQKSQDIRDRLQQGTLQSLTSRDFAEATLSSSIISWFASVDTNNRLTSKNTGVITLRYPSAGLFFLKQGVSSLFGAAASISPEAMAMDVDRDIVISLAKDGDSDKAARLSLSQGVFGSINEAEIPQRLFANPQNPGGVATIQAQQIANDQGIPIYRINASNATTIIPLLLINPDDLADIQDAVNAGLEVAVPKTPINFNGRSVLGTVISDPASGSASFLISGGANGALIFIKSILVLGGLLLLSLLVLLTPLAPLALPIILGLILGMLILLGIFAIGGGAAFENLSIFNLTPCQLAAVILIGLGLIVIAPAMATALSLSLGVSLVVAGQIVYALRVILGVGVVIRQFLC